MKAYPSISGRSPFRRLLLDHPLLWVMLGIPLFMHLSRLPPDSWNVEILIARNLLDGFGFVVAPLDPPALWRPPLPIALLLPIQALFRDPRTIYGIFGTLCVVGFLVSMFYLMKTLSGNLAAHFSQMMILTTPALTSLLGHQLAMVGYLPIFGLVTVSILTTIWSWQRGGWGWDLLAGFCWGIAFLARPEALLPFAASLFAGMVFHRSLGIARRRVAWRLVLQTAAFLVIYVPSVLVLGQLQQRHHLIGQETLITFYAGSHYGSSAYTGDGDAEGYSDSVAQFGSPEKYRYSLIRFAFAHPRAIYDRIMINLWRFAALIRSRKILNVLDCLAFLVFGSILVFARAPSIAAFPLFGFLTLLVIASPYFLIFHMDIRYALLFVTVMLIWLAVAALVFWTWLGKRLVRARIGQWRFVLPTAALVILCAVKLSHSISIAQSQTVDLLPWQQFAAGFRAKVSPESTPVVGYIHTDGAMLSGGDVLWLSYFSRTALPWCGSPECVSDSVFPRSRIYSFRGKKPDYLWMPDERVQELMGPDARVLARIPVSGHGAYSLVQATASFSMDGTP